MFKIGDIVEITDESDATGMLDFVKGKGYTVELYAGGMVNVVNESGKLGWYSKHHFKLKEKEEKKVETLFKAGQVVWDTSYGRGVVCSVYLPSQTTEGQVQVEFDSAKGSKVWYTLDGKYQLEKGVVHRTLFFSEPKIEAATEPVFEPVLKEGQPIILTRQGVEVQMVAGWVNKETPTEIDLMTTTDTSVIYKKNEWKVFSVGDQIIFN